MYATAGHKMLDGINGGLNRVSKYVQGYSQPKFS